MFTPTDGVKLVDSVRMGKQRGSRLTIYEGRLTIDDGVTRERQAIFGVPASAARRRFGIRDQRFIC